MLAGLLATFLLTPGGLSVSTAKVDITPDVPLPLGGYSERGSKLSEPGGDHLYARTVLFSGGRTKIALVSVEILTIPESLVREVKKRIPADVALFMGATHTHSAPDSQMLNDRMTFFIPGIAKYNSKWLDWYAERIAKSVNTSLAATPSELYDLSIKEAHVDVNIGRRKFADPDKLETEIDAREVGDRSARMVRLTLEYAAHGTIYTSRELHTRGDWPGAVSDVTGMAVIQGAIGDVLPKEYGKSSPESIKIVRDRLLGALQQARSQIVWRPRMPISSVNVPISLDPIKPHPTMAKSYGVPEMFADSIVGQFAPSKASITAFRIGKLAVVGVPGEPTSVLGRQIRDAGRRMGFSSVLVCSHVNGWVGYILSPEDYDLGGYEATLSFYGREEGAKVVTAGIEALKELSGSRR